MPEQFVPGGEVNDDTMDAIRGEYPVLKLHDWSDLPVVARRLRKAWFDEQEEPNVPN